MLDKMQLNSKAIQLRKELGEDDFSPIDIFPLAQNIEKLTLFYYPLGENISGACVKSHDMSIIAINSGMSYGRQRFTLAHEFYHLYFDSSTTHTICHKDLSTTSNIEKEANFFASYFLMPYSSLDICLNETFNSKNAPLSLNAIVKIEQFFGISRQALLVRLVDEKRIATPIDPAFQSDIINSARKLGYDTKLYLPNQETEKRRVYGHYIKMTEDLLNADLISNGKYEQLLLDAYREDLVYGLNEDGGEIVD